MIQNSIFQEGTMADYKSIAQPLTSNKQTGMDGIKLLKEIFFKPKLRYIHVYVKGTNQKTFEV